jgi:hypothetical protein
VTWVTWLTWASLIASILAPPITFVAGFAGSYIASKRASKQAAHEEEYRLGIDPDQHDNQGETIMASLDATKQVFNHAFALVRASRTAASDGFGVDDITAGMADGPVKDALVGLVDAAGQVPAELGDLSPMEALDLGQHLLATLRQL